MGRYIRGISQSPENRAKFVRSIMPDRKLNILQLSGSPVAGVPYLLSDLFNKYTKHESKTLTSAPGYRDGRCWSRPDANISSTSEAIKLITWADVIILHNGGRHNTARKLRKLLVGKKLVPYYHSEPQRVDRSWEKAGVPSYVIAQGHATLYPKLKRIPNIIDIWDPRHMPLEEKVHPGKQLLVAFCPSNTISHEKLCKSRMPFSSKGVPETRVAIEKLNKVPGIHVDTIRGVPFGRCMEMRKKYHILIDEVVTGSYHRCALEAMSHGQLPITAVSPVVEGFVREVSGGVAPWYHATPETLYDRIVSLKNDPEILQDILSYPREWMEEYWEPKHLMEKYWLPAVEK